MAVYILPGIIVLLLGALLLVPKPSPKQGIIQGRVSSTSATSTLIARPLTKNTTSTEIVLSPGSDYKLLIPVGDYEFKIKESNRRSPQLPRTLTIGVNTSAIFDLSVE